MENYLEINKKSWANKLDAHYASEFYNVPEFIKGKSSLNSIELDILGDVKGKSILHLQCHFGQDSMSLSRMGAKVTAVDFSEKSIAKAKELAHEIGVDTQFICADIFDLPNHLNQQFDIVFTSYGTIIWLPNITKWANVVNRFLKPGGTFVFADFHPAVWMYDDNFENVIYGYNQSEAIVEDEVGTYAEKEADISQQSVTWNHGLSSTVNSLLATGLQIKQLLEFNYAPYDFVGGCVEYEPGKYRIKKFGDKMPLVYAIEAFKAER